VTDVSAQHSTQPFLAQHFLTDQFLTEQFLTEQFLTEQFLTQGGALERALADAGGPVFEARREQAALAAAVERALATGEHLVAEAGTGVGKSLAYLVPALQSGLRVVVATATKALQEQLLAKDVPVAAAVVGRPVNVRVLKGRANYLCRRQLQGFQPFLMAEGRDARAWEAMQDWLETTETGDRAELTVEPSDALWAEVAVGPDRCGGRRCPFVSACFAEAARERAAEADLVIVNHALYFAHVASGGGVLPEHDAVVFDEGHRLEESAAAWLGGRVSRAGLKRLSLDIERACRASQRPYPARQADRVERSGDRLLRAVAPSAGRRRLREVPPEPALVLVDALGDLADALLGNGEELDALARRALGAAGEVEACLEVDSHERVVWSEPDAVAWAPVDVSGELAERLWDDGPTAILVSATLTTGEDAGFVRRRLGLAHAREAVVGSPYDFPEQALLYVPRAMPDPRSDGFTARAGDEIVSLLALSEGRALVLTSSYRALDAYRERVRERVPYDVLVQGEAPRERLLERFRDEVGSVLIATSTFWQGVDVPGESLSLLVIDKLPFSAPGDPLHEARCEAVERAGGDWFRDYALPTAMLQLRQGFGRLIRGHADRGVVAILDPRLRTRPYGRAFLGALPRCPIAEDPAAVAAFFGDQVPVSA
jgi:ATP-dependent DNA helicase DinG